VRDREGIPLGMGQEPRRAARPTPLRALYR
jgi:hypothetical protein